MARFATPLALLASPAKALASRGLRLFTLASLLAIGASAYYHFVHFNGRLAPFAPMVERFDLSALPDKTLVFTIADVTPANLAANDSQAAFISQIRSAAKVWNDVETSELRIRFGGLFAPGQSPVNQGDSPTVEVSFEELPPGTNGLTFVSSRQEPASDASGRFLPIQKSIVQINTRELASRPSWSEQLFLTAVHEFGHALGLQHSFVSGAMATEVTRATTKIRPISPDDVAGLSVLYPTASFRETLGTISGRVTLDGQATNMASVVAIAPRGAAVSAITNPDGTYRIEGIPPGQYYLYVHPLPPALPGESFPGNVYPAVDLQNRPFDAALTFDTIFYPNSKTPNTPVAVEAGVVRDGLNFAVARRAGGPSIHSIQSYSFPGTRAVKPAHLYSSAARNLMIFTGYGVLGLQPAGSGLQVQSLGSFASIVPNSLRAYSSAPDSYLQMDWQFLPFSQEGPGHLLFSRNNEIYVLPYGLRLAERTPPRVDSITVQPDGQSAVISGQNLTVESDIFFDGIESLIRSQDEQGRLVVSVPPASNGYRAAITAYNPDGQSSLFLQNGFTFAFDGIAEPANTGISLVPNSLPAGSESLVEINGPSVFSTNFTSLGFNSPDVRVKNFWVVGPGRILANISVGNRLAGNGFNMTALSGLRVLTQNNALNVSVPGSRIMQLALPAGARGFTPGSPATIIVNGGPSSLAGAQVTVNNQPMAVVGIEGNQINFLVPANLPQGVGVLRVQVGNEAALPLGVQILQPAATILSVVAGVTSPINDSRPARPGEFLTITLLNPPTLGANPKITVSVGNVEHRPLSITASADRLQFQIVVSNLVPTGVHALNIAIEDLPVPAFSLPVRQ